MKVMTQEQLIEHNKQIVLSQIQEKIDKDKEEYEKNKKEQQRINDIEQGLNEVTNKVNSIEIPKDIARLGDIPKDYVKLKEIENIKNDINKIKNKEEPYKKNEVYNKQEVYNKNEVYNKDETYPKLKLYTKEQLYTKDETYNKKEIDTKIQGINIIDSYSKSETYKKNEVYSKEQVYTKNEVYNKEETFHKGEVYSKEDIDRRLAKQKAFTTGRIDYNNIIQVGTNKLLGRYDAGTGSAQEIGLNSAQFTIINGILNYTDSSNNLPLIANGEGQVTFTSTGLENISLLFEPIGQRMQIGNTVQGGLVMELVATNTDTWTSFKFQLPDINGLGIMNDAYSSVCGTGTFVYDDTTLQPIPAYVYFDQVDRKGIVRFYIGTQVTGKVFVNFNYCVIL